jgi:hypothetical protein
VHAALDGWYAAARAALDGGARRLWATVYAALDALGTC